MTPQNAKMALATHKEIQRLEKVLEEQETYSSVAVDYSVHRWRVGDEWVAIGIKLPRNIVIDEINRQLKAKHELLQTLGVEYDRHAQL